MSRIMHLGSSISGGNTKDCYKTTDNANTSIVDTDYIPISDTNGNKKKSTWSNIKTVLGNVFALKNNTVIIGSLSMGRRANTTIGTNSVAFGNSCEASGWVSQAYGYGTVASGDNACHAEGFNTTASGSTSHSEGYSTTASGLNSHSEGANTTASGYISHAEGYYSTASGNYGSHAEGYYTKASSNYQHVQGKFNVEDTEGNYAHIVGNGNSDSARKDIHRLAWTGDAWFAGDVTDGKGNTLSGLIKSKKITNTTTSANANLTLSINAKTTIPLFVKGTLSGTTTPVVVQPYQFSNGNIDAFNSAWGAKVYKETLTSGNIVPLTSAAIDMIVFYFERTNA